MNDMVALRKHVPFQKWDELAGFIAQERKGIGTPNLEWEWMLTSLHVSSGMPLPLEVDHQSMRTYFDSCNPVENYMGPTFGWYATPDVLRCPGLVQTFNDPRLLGLVESYLGCTPTLHSVAAWWSYPSEEPQCLNQQFFHRDNDDWRFLTVFLYLTDVDEQSGPHQLIPGTHKGGPAGYGKGFSDVVETQYADQIVTLLGPAGTMHAVNTMALHRGLVPSKPRLCAWGRFGLGANGMNSIDLEMAPLPWAECALEDTPRARYINRLIFA